MHLYFRYICRPSGRGQPPRIPSSISALESKNARIPVFHNEFQLLTRAFHANRDLPLLPGLKGKKVVLTVCGGNIDPAILSRVIEKGLVHDGRLTRFTAVISDRPGGLAELTRVVAGCGASIKDIEHDRAFSGPDVSAVNAVCTVETRDHAHIRELHRALRKHGFPVLVAK